MLLITYSSSRGETSVSSNQFKLRNTLKRSSPKEGAEPAPMLNLKQIFLPVVASCCLPSSWDHFPRDPQETRAGVHRHCVCSILVPRGTHAAVQALWAVQAPSCTTSTRCTGAAGVHALRSPPAQR